MNLSKQVDAIIVVLFAIKIVARFKTNNLRERVRKKKGGEW